MQCHKDACVAVCKLRILLLCEQLRNAFTQDRYHAHLCVGVQVVQRPSASGRRPDLLLLLVFVGKKSCGPRPFTNVALLPHCHLI